MAKKIPPPSVHQTAIGNDNIQVVGSHNVITRITNFFAGDSEQQRAQRNRRAMLELVKNTWITGVLEKSLYNEVFIQLGMEERPGAVDHPWDVQVQMPNHDARTLPTGTLMIQVFDEMNGAMLILGEPGSGKTTMLLELARDCIDRALLDDNQPIPVVFNLSSWDGKQAIEDWLVDELRTKYTVPKKIAEGWVTNDDLQLMLDGLDELKRENRAACAEAINEFHQKHGLATPLTVCSRIADYEALTTKLNLSGAILLQPLTPKQIDEYFGEAGPELEGAQQILQADEVLQDLVKQPLMLSIFTLACWGASPEAIAPENRETSEQHRRHLFDTYIRQMFERVARTKNERYTAEKTKNRLKWLAQTMLRYSQSVFLIESMQPNWLSTHQARILYRAMVGLIIGLILGLIFGLFFGPVIGMIVGFIVALVFWIKGGEIGGLFGGKSNKSIDEIELIEVLKWSTGPSKHKLTLVAVLGLGSGSIVGVTLGIILNSSTGRTFGVLSGVTVGIIAWLLESLRTGAIENRTTPNQGIWNSIGSAIKMGSLFTLTEGLLFGLLLYFLVDWYLRSDQAINVGISIGIAFGLLGSLDYGGRAVIQHLALRFILSIKGFTPWNYVRFLDYCVDRIFLRRVGGGYIFVHRLLMEHFADMYPADEK